MKQIIVSLFDLFFSHVTDVNGNKIENPEDHDSYSAKATTVTMIAIIIILASIDKNKKREQMYVATTASAQGYKGQALWVLYKTFSTIRSCLPLS